MSANRANIDWHLMNMVGGRDIPVRGQSGFCRGAIAIRTVGQIGLGIFVNRGTEDSCDFRGLNGQSPILDGGSEQLLHESSLTQNYDLGAKEELPDGRVFRYCKSAGTEVLTPKRGTHFTDTGYISYTSFVASAAVKDTEITIPAATHGALTKDQLRGGYVVIFDGSAVNDVTHEIAGNDAADADALFKVRLATPLSVTITTADACEVYSNPWASLSQASSVVLPYAGVPVYSVTAAANYFWLQTKGIKFVDPQAGVGADNGGILAYWRHDGTLQKGETALTATVPVNDTIQPAGTVVAGSQSGNGPLINLLGF